LSPQNLGGKVVASTYCEIELNTNDHNPAFAQPGTAAICRMYKRLFGDVQEVTMVATSINAVRKMKARAFDIK
jgi:hypothetical protein